MNRREVLAMLIASGLLSPRMARSQGDLPEFLRKAAPAERYVVDLFERRDVILLAEDHAIRDVLKFVGSLIPSLHAAGVRVLGMEFGAAERQAELDALVTDASFNAAAARDMMFFYNVGWAYNEYQDLYRAAWAFNRTRPRGTPPFRVLNLSYQYDWTAFQGTRTPEVMARVFAQGTPDSYRARVVQREVLAKGGKALLLVGLPHAYTRFESPYLLVNADSFCGHDDGWLGNRLYRAAPGRVANVLLHQPLPNRPGVEPALVLPGGRTIEQVMASMGNPRTGFDLVGTPVGRLPDLSAHAICDASLTLEQVFDGYVFLAPISQLEGCTIDERFFDGRRWEDIRRQIPDPDWRGDIPSLEVFWRQIREFVDLDRRYAGLR